MVLEKYPLHISEYFDILCDIWTNVELKNGNSENECTPDGSGVRFLRVRKNQTDTLPPLLTDLNRNNNERMFHPWVNLSTEIRLQAQPPGDKPLKSECQTFIRLPKTNDAFTLASPDLRKDRSWLYRHRVWQSKHHLQALAMIYSMHSFFETLFWSSHNSIIKSPGRAVVKLQFMPWDSCEDITGCVNKIFTRVTFLGTKPQTDR